MYRVLARKYRPSTFDDLIGQEVLVRTLTNAFASGRIAHAFMLTGIRGIGKTTTARIIARGLNCIGPDGNGGATTTPCGVCANCVAIGEDRHVDVIEMDAASRTGVDDIRDIIDSVPYAPVNARYKIYIIDEVHMLSKNAFNALLKTLEEPPPYVKFIFATTEIRKIPVTIISRCQRFDLRRVETSELARHLQNVAGKESIALDDACAQLIAVAAEGSVRDSLSILDQAIAMHTNEQGITTIEVASLRGMLGLADKSTLFTLLDHVLSGKSEEALTLTQSMQTAGADGLQLLHDLIEITHYISRIAAAPALARDVHYGDHEQSLASHLASTHTMGKLARCWQLLLKGLEEMRIATHPFATLEMLLLRIAYTANLPTPAALIRALESGEQALPSKPQSAQTLSFEVPAARAEASYSSAPARSAQQALAVQPQPVQASFASPENFHDVVALFDEKREAILHAHLTHDLQLVSFTTGQIELHPISYLAPDIAVRIQRRLNEWTDTRWSIRFVDTAGEETIAQRTEKAKAQAVEYALAHPRAQEFLQHFADAKLVHFTPNT